MKTSLRTALAALTLATLAGCWSYVPAGSADFQQGYRDGCASGYSDAGWDSYLDRYQKDHAAYAASADYRRGWDQGHDSCYTEEITHPHMGRPF
jgi:hypothetical protein